MSFSSPVHFAVQEIISVTTAISALVVYRRAVFAILIVSTAPKSAKNAACAANVALISVTPAVHVAIALPYAKTAVANVAGVDRKTSASTVTDAPLAAIPANSTKSVLSAVVRTQALTSAKFVCAAMNTVIVLKTNARAATKRRTCAGTATDVRIVAIAVISRKKIAAQSAETTTLYSVENVLPARNAQESAVGVTSQEPAAMISVPTVTSARDVVTAEETRSL